MERSHEAVTFKVELSAGERSIEASVDIPDREMRFADLVPVIFAFSNAIVALAEENTTSAGKTISCRAGCGACCRQLVPVSEVEAIYLTEAVAELPEARQARVREAFRRAHESLGEDLMARLRNASALTTLEARRAIGLEYFRRRVPCPFLENESCSIHEWRPLSCREYLVTSPAQNCSNPAPGSIGPVPLALKLSEVLYAIEDGPGERRPHWVPLVLALDWAEAHPADAPRAAGPKLFERLLQRIAELRGTAA